MLHGSPLRSVTPTLYSAHMLLVSDDTLKSGYVSVIQVLTSGCSQQDLAEQASGVVEAVLQGRNCVVLAMGQPAFGKAHTLLGEDPNDPEVDSASPGMLPAMHVFVQRYSHAA